MRMLTTESTGGGCDRTIPNHNYCGMENKGKSERHSRFVASELLTENNDMLSYLFFIIYN